MLAAGLLLTLLLFSQRAAVFIPSFQLLDADTCMQLPPQEHALSALLAAPRTNATMAVLPPFEPTCFVIHELREQVRDAAFEQDHSVTGKPSCQATCSDSSRSVHTCLLYVPDTV